jgi:hypothetical protein
VITSCTFCGLIKRPWLCILKLMLHASDENLNTFRTVYPEIPSEEIPVAYECFCRYVQLAIEVARGASGSDLTSGFGGGTVSVGLVDPTSNFTNNG